MLDIIEDILMLNIRYITNETYFSVLFRLLSTASYLNDKFASEKLSAI